MKLGLNTDSLGAWPIGEVLDFAAECGLDHVELATGGWSSGPHLDVHRLVEDRDAREHLRDAVAERGLTISALTCSGNPLDFGDRGAAHEADTKATITLASQLEIPKVVMMSGLPPAPGDTHPNWIVVSWPPEAHEVLEWQWTERLLPYWTELVDFTNGQGDVRLALELHPQQLVYNVPTLMRLREAVGPTIGANLDPSHLMWMGADPVKCATALGEALYYVHAKDARVESPAALRTVFENLPLFNVDRSRRAWNYVTLGTGHDVSFWRSFVGALDEAGYDGVLSIEHEDEATTPDQGIKDSVQVLLEAGVRDR